MTPWDLDDLELLPGWYDDWVIVGRERLRQRLLHAVETLSRELVRGGRCAQAVEAALVVVNAEPFRESAHRVLIEAHLAEGNWVELSDDSFELTGRPGVLVRIVSLEGDSLTLDPATPAPPWSQDLVNPTGRRWDQAETGGIVLRNGAVTVRETPAGAAPDQAVWTELEDGRIVRWKSYSPAALLHRWNVTRHRAVRFGGERI